MKKYNVFFFSLVIVCTFFCCSKLPKDVKQALELSEENKAELQKVIDHYQKPRDSLKLKAAYFLIKNLPAQYHKPYNNLQKHFISDIHDEFNKEGLQEATLYETSKWVDTINVKGNYEVWYPKLTAKWDSLKKQYRQPQKNIVHDIKVISKELLIDNIDQAFSAWQTSPWYKKITFDTFCRSILPYRNFYDIPINNRKTLAKAFAKYKKSTILKTVQAFHKAHKLYFLYHDTFENFSHMQIDDVYKSRHITCRQHSSVKLAGLRSLGIPCNQVFGLDGTAWIRFQDEEGKTYDYEGEYITDWKNDLSIPGRRGDDYAKIFMRSFEIQPDNVKNIPSENIPSFFRNRNIKDVSKDHMKVTDVNVSLKYNAPIKTDKVFLCFFNKKLLKWDAAAMANIKDKNAVFHEMGRQKIYYPAYYINKEYYPAGEPFYISEHEKITYLPAEASFINISLKRKTDWGYTENGFAQRSVGMWFEGANESKFKNPTRLATITKKPEHSEELLIDNDSKFRYLRIITLDTTKSPIPHQTTGIHLAELSFFNTEKQKVKGGAIVSIGANKDTPAKNLYDDDIRTNFDIDNKPGWVGIDAGKPINVSKVKYLIRNSFNTIEPGDTYELFYWNNKWMSLGEKKAESDYVEFSAPEDAVLWLRNRTKGKEENIFFMKDGKQIWG